MIPRQLDKPGKGVCTDRDRRAAESVCFGGHIAVQASQRKKVMQVGCRNVRHVRQADKKSVGPSGQGMLRGERQRGAHAPPRLRVVEQVKSSAGVDLPAGGRAQRADGNSLQEGQVRKFNRDVGAKRQTMKRLKQFVGAKALRAARRKDHPNGSTNLDQVQSVPSRLRSGPKEPEHWGPGHDQSTRWVL